jgi:Cdc6-like AAA superfamily ATPase
MHPKKQRNVNRLVANSEQTKDTLRNISQLKKIIECALISPYIKNEKPLSLLIVAKPESGKTTVMKLYVRNKGIVYLTDCTAYGIQRDLLPKIVAGEVRTIIIADLLTPLSKAFKTKQAFIAFLNNLIEEGVAKITTYAMTWDKEVRANVITAVTDQAIDDGRHEWAKLGFLSRFIIFSYSYSMSTVVEILSSYSRHGLVSQPIDFQLPNKEVDIDLPSYIADKLDSIAMKIGEQFQLHGIRAKINLRSLIKALAYRNERKIVTEQEYAELVELADYMNFEYNPLR